MGHKKSKMIDIDESFINEPVNCQKKGKKHKFFPEEKKYHINFIPKTKNQELALKYFNTKSIVVLSGVAGSGKCLCGESELELYVDDELYDFLIN